MTLREMIDNDIIFIEDIGAFRTDGTKQPLETLLEYCDYKIDLIEPRSDDKLYLWLKRN